ncbi:hypothetical protein CYMTET_3653 [Cymbomonas tetramitiformis]|uniref:J domain-containing protein n=1 Tax=Cymbomonas tetramitiformis TaxID=36881 RepID=A0AAE0H380_9CHLO|nr:hypothetical protein CYMTET_3653 [Cymbomonas tetramitiformis]
MREDSRPEASHVEIVDLVESEDEENPMNAFDAHGAPANTSARAGLEDADDTEDAHDIVDDEEDDNDTFTEYMKKDGWDLELGNEDLEDMDVEITHCGPVEEHRGFPDDAGEVAGPSTGAAGSSSRAGASQSLEPLRGGEPSGATRAEAPGSEGEERTKEGSEESEDEVEFIRDTRPPSKVQEVLNERLHKSSAVRARKGSAAARSAPNYEHISHLHPDWAAAVAAINSNPEVEESSSLGTRGRGEDVLDAMGVLDDEGEGGSPTPQPGAAHSEEQEEQAEAATMDTNVEGDISDDGAGTSSDEFGGDRASQLQSQGAREPSPPPAVQRCPLQKPKGIFKPRIPVRPRRGSNKSQPTAGTCSAAAHNTDEVSASGRSGMPQDAEPGVPDTPLMPHGADAAQGAPQEGAGHISAASERWEGSEKDCLPSSRDDFGAESNAEREVQHDDDDDDDDAVVLDRRALLDSLGAEHRQSAEQEEEEQRQAVLRQQREEALRERKRKRCELEKKRIIEDRQRKKLLEFRNRVQIEEASDEDRQKIRSIVRSELERKMRRCDGMLAILAMVGMPLASSASQDPSSKQIAAMYKKALHRFHPDRIKRCGGSLRTEVEAEETFKLLQSKSGMVSER